MGDFYVYAAALNRLGSPVLTSGTRVSPAFVDEFTDFYNNGVNAVPERYIMATGTYSLNSTLSLGSYKSVYGGFAGGWPRYIAGNPTVLERVWVGTSADLVQNAQITDPNLTLDGFTIQYSQTAP
ncbi:MAG: hypothetical protein A2087_05340 [Spirochaetes bacterium GWD1_61_31]|nr:MAG: hypothetical protein A2Y37_10595 [Spirochaetes bacterium GWB1_60_80]OHD29770.1 MAG: hypothetical protein A2004_04870 [Spirochaetes bacterium GWC1_61_12]OHD42888.1 MAG: hypothetical protein A2Y35_13920 [Spirochaetes bacterium GWE1_60_18]OHD43465.1 MAG: hypothetical protein A2087_05340 [Spirochaetes bacterium GWD1_61_31]OHD59574.1 MAG: hypothetical protein A2Y32_12635 [Spirochaetes bacterium GWF1_60_12]HAP43752.1 hypothetical protein [Spirochaetaceae bacterium]